MDLREIARLAGHGDLTGAILSPWSLSDPELGARVTALREQGEIVVELLPGQAENEGLRCDRHLVRQSGQWVIQAIDGK
jgi:ATP phosphoribosyltransferase regulatory subunit